MKKNYIILFGLFLCTGCESVQIDKQSSNDGIMTLRSEGFAITDTTIDVIGTSEKETLNYTLNTKVVDSAFSFTPLDIMNVLSEFPIEYNHEALFTTGILKETCISFEMNEDGNTKLITINTPYKASIHEEFFEIIKQLSIAIVPELITTTNLELFLNESLSFNHLSPGTSNEFTYGTITFTTALENEELSIQIKPFIN